MDLHYVAETQLMYYERTEKERKHDELYWSEILIGKRLCDGPATDDKVFIYLTP